MYRWLALGVLSLSLLTACGSSTNSASTGEPGLDPKIYDAPIDQVFTAAEKAFTQWPRGRGVLESDRAKGTVHGYSETNLWKFQDDIYVTLTEPEPNKTKVEVTSKGRVGESDFGGNARNISEYLSTVDDLLAAKP